MFIGIYVGFFFVVEGADVDVGVFVVAKLVEGAEFGTGVGEVVVDVE